jgi:hypothetical protein
MDAPVCQSSAQTILVFLGLNPSEEVVVRLPFEKTGLLVFDIPCRLHKTAKSDAAIPF